jgi:AraC family transcriptional regulator, transcriptional activator of pobA
MRHPSGIQGAAGHVGMAGRVRTVRPDGTPVVRFDERPGRPAVHLLHLDDRRDAAPTLPLEHRHAHDFHVLLYVERGGGDARFDSRVEPLRTGQVLAVPPGHVIGVGNSSPVVGAMWAVAFRFDAVPALAGAASFGWTAHPLFGAFPLDAIGHGVVPRPERASWLSWLGDLEVETASVARTGSADAIRATLTRLLVASARLAAGDERTAPHGSVPAADPLVAGVLELVERLYSTPASTAELARTLGYTPGHLTTILRERTGRTVMDWLTERRMTESRRLLLDTDLPLSAIATRVGYSDAAYLVRRFRIAHGTTPQQWRRAARSTAQAAGT